MCRTQEPYHQLKGQGHSGQLNLANICYIYSDDGCSYPDCNFEVHGRISE